MTSDTIQWRAVGRRMWTCRAREMLITVAESQFTAGRFRWTILNRKLGKMVAWGRARVAGGILQHDDMRTGGIDEAPALPVLWSARNADHHRALQYVALRAAAMVDPSLVWVMGADALAREHAQDLAQ